MGRLHHGESAFVHEAVADVFIDIFGSGTDGLRVGPAAGPASDIGPVISVRAKADLACLLDPAVLAGARIVALTDAPEVGNYSPPTLLSTFRNIVAARDEIFGAAVPVMSWRDEVAMRE